MDKHTKTPWHIGELPPAAGFTIHGHDGEQIASLAEWTDCETLPKIAAALSLLEETRKGGSNV